MFGCVKDIPKEVAEVTAKWWADKISGDVKFDNGDTSFGGLMCAAMAKTLVKSVTDEQKKTFVDKLTEIILKNQFDCVSVDYHPDGQLKEAAEAAGINENNFPWKTVTWMLYDKETDSFRVVVREGYCADSQQIYPVQDGEQE